ncbi:bifunctional helix-turn-helix transcriptional regulator/GNAT family N-acetyltransferase [Methylocapsa sp. S129]|uniref:bifunctional helix-turn-helix transcriptional regulator/GNAT family N-acetyltransferase n=1 Tax=Methylocapsa sp. S129 TaxID=1641869 RepID=UPI00131EB66C|nr:bifunctional helix-turn-helix transcriptional regulator/GNAT family N-acetyltransferase [Methylocapsa sp. S129]
MDAIGRLRRFNRFYTRQLGLLDERLSHSPFSLTQARVLYELAHRTSPTAAEIARDLGLDPAQLSRILKAFRTRRLLTSAPSAAHAKHKLLSLTPKGRAAFDTLEQATVEQIAGMLAPLGETARRRLIGAADVIEEALSPRAPSGPDFILRSPRVGDIGWVIHRQGALYAGEYGWDWTFDGLVAEILGGFVKNFDPVREQGWLAERHGEIVGSIFLMRGDDEATGKLRLLYIEPEARGLGIGAALVDACVARAREVGYARLTLWTNDILVAARRLYEAAGFKLISEEPHVSFGKALVGQTWTMDLHAIT